MELVIPFDLKYKWSAGFHIQKFFEGLKNGKLLCSKCGKCGHALIPPVPVCPRCHTEMGQFVELSPRGSVIGYSYVTDPIYDPGTGAMREIPYMTASIVLDGEPDAAFSHLLEEKDPGKVKIGMRVEAVYRPVRERHGRMEDIIHFKTISSS